MIEINYILIIALGILSMVLGAIWYGPLFGKAWARLNGVDPDNKEAMKEMAKGMGPIYLIQFILLLWCLLCMSTPNQPKT